MNSPFPPPAPGPYPGPQPGPPGPPPSPATSRGKGCLVVGGVIVLIVAVAAVFGGIRLVSYAQDQAATHVDSAEVGDCVRDTPDDTSSKVRITPCGETQATHKVLGLQATAGSEDCIDVAGAVRQVSNEDGRVCLGEKDVDPARSANAAKVGDCLAVSGDDAETVPCTDAEATHTVLSREKTNSIMGSNPFQCRDVPGSESSYSISWDGDPLSRLGSKGLTYCLGVKE